jgi:hypothetical protein
MDLFWLRVHTEGLGVPLPASMFMPLDHLLHAMGQHCFTPAATALSL